MRLALKLGTVGLGIVIGVVATALVLPPNGPVAADPAPDAGGASSAPAQAAGRAVPADSPRRTAVVEAVEKVAPAVVNISTEILVENPYGGARGPSLLEWFFGQDPFLDRRDRFRPREQYVPNSLGSGVIVSPQGYVLTNEHVISRASRITITFRDERRVQADLVGADRASDLAVLKISEPGPWPFVPLGRSDDLMIGETVVAIGNPFGLQSTVTTGVVSAVGRTLPGPDEETEFTDFIQTDAAINPGNSGGALVNILGELIGINSQIVARGQNLGFAIPIDRARTVLDELIQFGEVRPYWTGFVAAEPSRRLAERLGLEPGRGLVVWRVERDSPASRAGIERFDVIVAAAGRPVGSRPQLDTVLSHIPIGETVPIELIRDGRRLTVDLKLEEFPRDRALEFAWEVLGFSVVEGRRGGLVIDRIRPGSPAAHLEPGLALVAINGRRVDSLEAFEKAIPGALQQRSVALLLATRRHLINTSLRLF